MLNFKENIFECSLKIIKWTIFVILFSFFCIFEIEPNPSYKHSWSFPSCPTSKLVPSEGRLKSNLILIDSDELSPAQDDARYYKVKMGVNYNHHIQRTCNLALDINIFVNQGLYK